MNQTAGLLRRDMGLTAPDDFYDRLIRAHEGLSDEASQLLNARLLFLLANHIGDDAVLEEAITAARAGV
jgi:hypothetical protein